MSEARARVSLADGVQLEFEGSEAFVNAQLEKFRRIIHGEPPAPVAVAAAAPQTDEARLSSLFAANNGSVAILKKIPGKNRAQQSLNAAKLLSVWPADADETRHRVVQRDFGRVQGTSLLRPKQHGDNA